MAAQHGQGVPPDMPELAAVPAQTDTGGPPPQPPHRIRRTRMGGLWVAAALFAVVLLLLLIFILENGRKVAISFFGATGHLPVGVALLLAAVLGVLLVIIPGTGRIVQLRMTARRHRRADLRQAAGMPPSPVPPAVPPPAQP